MQENMFKFGDKNPLVVCDFQMYTSQLNTLPMCYGLNTFEARKFLKKQTPFEECNTYPVEYAVLGHKKKKKSTPDARGRYYGKIYAKYEYLNSCKHDCGKLRIWWAYNLAIAASQGKM